MDLDGHWEFFSMTERWGEISDVQVFLYTHVLYLRNKTELWTARVPGRYDSPRALPSRDSIVVQEAEPSDLYPPLPPDSTLPIFRPQCHSSEPPPHIKRVRVAAYDGTPTLGLYLFHEARIAELLPPHPNLARFRGCLLDDTGVQILGLCYDRYAETLAERMRRRGPIDVASVMTQLGTAVAHVHAQNIVHNDVCDDNVMFVDRDGPHLVLIDFDSCVTRGLGLPRKRGPTAPGATTSEFENDHVGMQLVHGRLMQYERDMRRNRRA